MKSHANILSGSITKGLIAMSIPIMIMNVAQSLFNIIDMTVLGQLVNDSAVGAVGACGLLISICTVFLIGIATGTNIVIAKHLGSKNVAKAESTIGTALIFSVVSSIIMAILGFAFSETLLRLTNCPETLLPDAKLYCRIYFCGVPFIMLYNFCANIIRSTGDSKRPMYFLLSAGALKVVLNYCFIAFFKTTVSGVAFATIISMAAACVLSLNTIFNKMTEFDMTIKKIKFSFAELKNMLYIGVPTGLQSSLYTLANLVISSTVNKYGEYATTGISIANQFDGILYQICTACSFAVMPFVAQNVGAKNITRVKQIVLKAILITTVIGATFGGLSAVFSGQLSSIMSNNPEVIKYSQEKMIIISSTYFICGINEIFCASLRGLGKPIVSTVTTLVYMCLFRFVWVYVFFPLCPNFTFLYAVWPVGWTLSIITMLFFYFPTLKKLSLKYKGE